jgi:hypothetical protein
MTANSLLCSSCQVKERECVDCGRIFKSTNRLCEKCRAIERLCESCGNRFKGMHKLCHKCRSYEHECLACNKIINSASSMCGSCNRKDRICQTCNKFFKGTALVCPTCRATNRVCTRCYNEFTGISTQCSSCFRIDRECIICDRTFKGSVLICGICSGKDIAHTNRYRARKKQAEIIGPIPGSIYKSILLSGPCVYCGIIATTVDHITPLNRGGNEVESNLVQCCKYCNSSKSDKLLTEWNESRVTYGLMHSQKVFAIYISLTQRKTKVMVTPDGTT